MSLVPSLLRVISSVDGECLVLQAGEKPYVFSSGGQVRLGSRGLTGQAVTRIIERVLPADVQLLLETHGTAQHELAVPELPADRFSVLAARSGDDVWVEIRRRGEPRTATRAADPLATVATGAVAETDQSADVAGGAAADVHQLLRLAASRGASALYLSPGVHPSIRVDREVQPLSSARVTSEADVEAMLLALMPERTPESLRTGPPIGAVVEIPGLGSVRCASFHDHRGLGGVFRVMPARPARSRHLGLSREIQRLAGEPDGLIVVAGPTTREESSLASAFVDLISRTRRVRIATVEREVGVMHEQGSSFISQHEVRGGFDATLRETYAALGENPDVLVLDTKLDAAVMTLALDAAASGRLVICGTGDLSATSAVDGIVGMFPPDDHRVVRHALAHVLRGVIVQVMVNTTNGGRIAAREVLVNSPAVASAIAGGRTSELPTVIATGGPLGMVSLCDGLAALVQSGVVDAREALRYAGDKVEFTATLKRRGIDTTAIALPSF